MLYDYLKHHESEVDKDRALCGSYSLPTPPNSLALIAQSHFAPPPLLNHDYVQESHHFNYPHQNTSNQLIPYDSTQQSNVNQLVSYDNTDTTYYTSSNDDEDEEFNNLNQGLAFIARAFSKFSNKTNNRLRTSSNTRNQVVVQDGRFVIHNHNYERSGSGGYVGNSVNGQWFNATWDIGTILVLLRKGLKLLKLEIQKLGIQWFDAITAIGRVIWQMHVLNQELEVVHSISKHYSSLLWM